MAEPTGQPHPYGWPPQYAQGYPPSPPAPEQQAAAPSPYADPWARSYPTQPPGWPPPYGHQHPSQQQAQPKRPAPVDLPPDSGMVWAVVALVLTLCNPVGMTLAAVAIVKANSVAKRWAAGAYDEAREAAKQARMLALFGFLSNILCACGSGLLVAAMSGGAS